MSLSVVLSRWAAIALLLGLCAGCDEGGDITVPTVYLAAGQVADPTTSPFTGLAGVTVRAVTAPDLAPVVTDGDGNFVLHGLPPGTHRLVAEHPDRRTSMTFGFEVPSSVVDIGIPLFTDAQIDSILVANGAPPWDRGQALFGVFARRSNGLLLGSATATLSPSTGGTLVQTGTAEDPIVVVNAQPGSYSLNLSASGFLWDGPYSVRLEPGIVTFGAPRARPNLGGFVFADASTGSPVEGAVADIFRGPGLPPVTTDFLGRFTFVGVEEGTYVIHFSRAGYLSTLSWPETVDEDTTRTVLLFHADSLAAWAGQAGVTLDPSRGHLAAEVRNAAGGEVIEGVELDIGAAIGRSIPQSTRWPAMRLNLSAGEYEVRVMIEGTERARRSRVLVRGGAMSFIRLDVEPPAAARARRATAQR